MKSKKILVTGGVGFIRTNLVIELQKRGHDVLARDIYNTQRNNLIRTDVLRNTDVWMKQNYCVGE